MAGFETDVVPGKEPLRERMPEYLAKFSLGVAGCAALGLIFVWASDASFAQGFGYAMVGLGAIFLLSGGVAGGGVGGGYSNMGGSAGEGAQGATFDHASRYQAGAAAHDDRDVLRQQMFGAFGDPRERSRKRLRREVNPQAFWHVVAGFSYFALGGALVLSLAA